MDRETFDEIFDRELVAHLVDSGFSERGKSLYRFRLNVTIGFIRMGGRMASPGTAAWVIGIRHPYVWTHTPEELPGRKPFNPEEFPLRFNPMALMEGRDDRRYDPRFTYDMDYEVYQYGKREPEEVLSTVIDLRRFLLSDFVPWAEALSPCEIAAQIREHGRGLWMDGYWLKFYEQAADAEP